MHSTTQMKAEIMLSKTQVVPVVKNLPANEGYTRDESSIPGPKRSPGKGKKKQPILVFLPGKKIHGRSLAGYSPWGCKQSDTTEQRAHNTDES